MKGLATRDWRAEDLFFLRHPFALLTRSTHEKNTVFAFRQSAKNALLRHPKLRVRALVFFVRFRGRDFGGGWDMYGIFSLFFLPRFSRLETCAV